MGFFIAAILIMTVALIGTWLLLAYPFTAILISIPAILLAILVRKYRLQVYTRSIWKFIGQHSIKPADIEDVFVCGSIYSKKKFLLTTKDKLIIGTKHSIQEVPFSTVNQAFYSGGPGFGNFVMSLNDGTKVPVNIARGIDSLDIIKASSQLSFLQWVFYPLGTLALLASLYAHQEQIMTFARLLRDKKVNLVEDKNLSRTDSRRFWVTTVAACTYLLLGAVLLAIMKQL